MKVCPKCNSTYSDETLNFCLTDGVPLVVEEVLDEHLSRESAWHQAETLLDPRFSAPSSRQTAINPSSPTLELGTTTAQHLPYRKSNTALFALLGVALAVVLAGGGFWLFSRPSAPAANPAMLTENNPPTTPKRAVVELSPEQDAQVKQEITAFIQKWVETNEKKDADAHLEHYANTLEIYYNESGKDKNHVLADRLRAYKRYDSIQMQADNLKIAPESTESATLVFDKSWTMKNAQKTSTGSVQQEMHLSKHGGRWLIDAEKDLKVYFLNNRENQPTEGAVPAPQNQNQTPSNSATQALKYNR
jgi:hypothetical protein